jgi:hypothetical protein
LKIIFTITRCHRSKCFDQLFLDVDLFFLIVYIRYSRRHSGQLNLSRLSPKFLEIIFINKYERIISLRFGVYDANKVQQFIIVVVDNVIYFYIP